MRVTTDIPDERVAGLLCCGFEGGVGYWCRIIDYREPRKPEPVLDADACVPLPHIYPHADYPLTGGAVVCHVTDDPDPDDLVLDRAACERGLQLMAEKAPSHWGDFLAGREDAVTGDVFIQLCLLGEVVYG